MPLLAISLQYSSGSKTGTSGVSPKDSGPLRAYLSTIRGDSSSRSKTDNEEDNPPSGILTLDLFESSLLLGFPSPELLVRLSKEEDTGANLFGRGLYQWVVFVEKAKAADTPPCWFDELGAADEPEL